MQSDKKYALVAALIINEMVGNKCVTKRERITHLKVDEEDADGEVDEGVGGRNEVGFLVQNKNEGSGHCSLRGTEKKNMKSHTTTHNCP